MTLWSRLRALPKVPNVPKAAKGLRLPKWLGEIGWRTVAGAVLLGGIIHIGATLVVPWFGTGSALAKLRQTLPANQMVILPPPAPGKETLPFLLPGALYAMCRYDISSGSLTITAALAQAGWSLSLHTPQGDNFYVMPAQPLRRGDVNLTVVPGGDRLAEFNPAPRRVSAQETQVTSPSSEGLVIVRAPLRGLAWRAETEAILRRASCNAVKR